MWFTFPMKSKVLLFWCCALAPPAHMIREYLRSTTFHTFPKSKFQVLTIAQTMFRLCRSLLRQVLQPISLHDGAQVADSNRSQTLLIEQKVVR